MGQIGHGTKFYMGDDGDPIIYTRVASLNEISAGEDTTNSVANDHVDDADLYNRFIPGRVNPGEVSLVLDWDKDDADQTALLAAQGSNKNWRIEYPDGAVFDFYGHINKIGRPSTGDEEIISRMVSFKLSGSNTYTANPV